MFRQLEDASKCIDLLSILEWDVRQCYFPNNKEGRGQVGVSFTNCELSGPDQGMTSLRA